MRDETMTWWLHFTRNALALGLALLLAILTITIVVAAIAGVDGDRLAQVSQVTITPVVALCGTAFGFYFAQQAAARADERRSEPGGKAADPEADG